MNGLSENRNTLDLRLADFQLGEGKGEISPYCENNNTKEGVENGMSGPVIVTHLSENTGENEERMASETKDTKTMHNSVTSHAVEPNFVPSAERLDTADLSSASSTKSTKITGYLEDLSRTVDKVLASGGGVKEGLRSSNLSYLGVTPELSEMLLQHGEFPATPKVAPIPCTLNTPTFAAKEKDQGIYLDFRSTYPFTGRSMKTTADVLSSSSSNHSSAKSLPSIVSFDSGEGESAWSSVSPTSSAWMSAASNYGSDKTKAPQYVTPPACCNGLLQPHNWNPDLNEKFMFKDCKSSSYQEMYEHSDIPHQAYRNRTQLNSVIDMNMQREKRLPSRNTMYSYSCNQTYPGTDGEKKRNFNAETIMKKTVDAHQRGSREHLPPVPLKTPGNDPRLAEVLSFSKAYLGMPDSSTPLSQAIKSPIASMPFNTSESRAFPVMEVSRIVSGRNHLHDVVPEESSMTIEAHPLFLLLRFLASAEIYYETAPRFITTVLELLPSSTSELISMFLRGKPDYAYIYRTSTNIATEYVMRDAIMYAHRCLREKITSNEAAKNLANAEEVVMETEVDKVCRNYLDAVRYSTPPPPQQSLNVNSSSALNGNPMANFNQILEAFSPIPLSLDAAGLSLASAATPKYTKAVLAVTNWLREHEDQPYPDDDQKSILMSQTGLSSKEVTEIFSSRTDS